MTPINSSNKNDEINILCDTIRGLFQEHKYNEGLKIIQSAMNDYPHSPVPHNLMGILLEKEGKHSTAMRHFRAACALDPSYLPSRYNLENYGTFFSKGKCAYDIDDCPNDCSGNSHNLIYDIHNVGHVVRRR